MFYTFMYSTVNFENRLAWKTLKLFSQILKSFEFIQELCSCNTRQSSKSSSFRLWKKKSSGFKSSQDILLNVFFTCRCGRPEKAWEAREDIRQSERSIFRRFGRAWKINQSYQCGGVQFFSCFYTFHRNSAVEGLRNILSGFMTKCVLFLIIARCLVCFFIFNIEMNYGFQLLFDKKWYTISSDLLIGLFFHI